MHELLHAVWHELADTLRLVPCLFLTYLIMETLEHKSSERVEKWIAKSGRVGPLLGALVGLVPQCGFSAAAAGLYAGGVVSVGTLLAVFLSTSDEMLAIFLGGCVSSHVILTVLGIKLAVAVAAGFAADALLRGGRRPMQLEELCHREGCHCERGVWRSALHHTLQVGAFVLIVNLTLEALFVFLPVGTVMTLFHRVPILGVLMAALVGLIPSCAASVAVATLYLDGVLSAGAMLAGLLTGAGAGLSVLFRSRSSKRFLLFFVLALLGIGVTVGCLLDLTGLAVLLGI